jgi:hypothetical protein
VCSRLGDDDDGKRGGCRASIDVPQTKLSSELFRAVHRERLTDGVCGGHPKTGMGFKFLRIPTCLKFLLLWMSTWICHFICHHEVPKRSFNFVVSATTRNFVNFVDKNFI